jgi:hypothetical protein
MHIKTPRFQLAHRGSMAVVSRLRVHMTAERTLVPFAVGTCLVALELYEVLQGRTILLRAISGRVGPPRHGGVRSRGARICCPLRRVRRFSRIIVLEQYGSVCKVKFGRVVEVCCKVTLFDPKPSNVPSPLTLRAWRD